jgi:hypothetical protein
MKVAYREDEIFGIKYNATPLQLSTFLTQFLYCKDLILSLLFLGYSYCQTVKF